MQRRTFLKIGGMSGLALGWACSSDPAGMTGTSGTGGMNSGAGAGGAGGAGMMGPDGMPIGAGGTTSGEGNPSDVPLEAPDEPTGDAPACEAGAGAADGGPVQQNEVTAYVRIGVDESVTLFIDRVDMGQGVLTSMPMLIAEELDVDWQKVQSAHPDVDPRYPNMGTFASSSMASRFNAMRQAGATARQMLLAAAAQRLGVGVAELRTELGIVYHNASGRQATYGELAELAGTLPVPQNAPTKNQNDFVIVGTPRSQLNARAKAGGTAQYGIDVRLENMLVGLVARPPSLGGSLRSFNDAAARAVPGVQDVREIPSGVVVLADHFWAAHKGREALTVEWNAGPNGALSTEDMRSEMRVNMDGPNQTNDGNADQALAAAPAAQQLDVIYELPYLAHAPMEPLNAVADVRANSAEVWVGSQVPNGVVGIAANLAGVQQQNVTVHVPLLGGGFGRRAINDFVGDAISASRLAGRPVKVIYTREDDMRSAQYRPMNLNRLQGAVDADGWPNAWVHNIVTQSIFPGSATEGASTNYPYAMANRRVTLRAPSAGVDVFTWRSVGSSHNGFVVESFLDELAALGGKDPLEVRQRLLQQSNDPAAARYLAVLNDVAERADWGGTPQAGRARGLAIHRTFGTIVGQVAEVSIANNQVRVERVWATVDCGRAVNPRGIAAQCEGSIIFGLTAALYGQIDIEQGRPVQGNFDTYRLMRMSEAPDIDVNIINSGADLTGMGEPGVPPAAPAVTNAIFRLTGQRIRRLPIVLEL